MQLLNTLLDSETNILVAKNNSTSDLTRRQLLSKAAMAASVAALGSLALSNHSHGATTNLLYPDRTLKFRNVHTGESIITTYWSQGQYIADSLDEIDWVLRDFRTGETKKVDPRLLNILYLLNRKLETYGEFQVLSAYRSKKTNDMLRKTTEGVARRSFHMKARAIDIRIPKISTQHIQRAALRLNGGGVGFYPNSNFVHLDTGPVRTW